MPAPKNGVRDYNRSLGPRSSRPAEIVALDFETYYDDEYTLRKMSTSEYVRDKRFEAISVAIIRKGEREVYFGKKIAPALNKIKWDKVALLCHHTQFDGLILSHVFGHLPRYYMDTLSMARGLHPRFERNDLATVAARYNVVNKLTMPDFKGKHERDLTPADRKAISEYNLRDVDATIEIFEKMVVEMPDMEMDLIDVTVRMFADPVLCLDVKAAKIEHKREQDERREAISKSGALAYAAKLNAEGKLELPKLKKGEALTDERVLSSNKVFPELLRDLGVDPPMKVSKTTGKVAPALAKSDEEFTDLMSHPDDAVRALVSGRLAAKSTTGETRAARLLKSAEGGKRLPVYLNYCGAHTTRWSGGDKMNWQNLKKKGGIRRTIKAPPGYQIVVVDSSQIEVRVLAWLAGETWLLEAFRNGQDPYLIFGSEVYGFPINKKDHPLERFISKSCVLGLGFQMGPPKLQMSILAASIIQGLDPVRLDLSTCAGLVRKYRNKNKKIEGLWEFMNDDVLQELAMGRRGQVHSYKCLEYGRDFIRLKGGLSMHYPEAKCRIEGGEISPWSKHRTPMRISDGSYRTMKGRSKLYGGLMTENGVQFLARMAVAWQMLEIASKYRVVMMSHDEISFLAKTKEAKAAHEFAIKVMHTPPPFMPGLPVAAEGSYDTFYSK